jgi:hypothetical protein
MPNLGAASIGGYMDFVKQMLSLRDQRLQEERYRQLERQAQQEQMMKMVGNIGSAITSYGQKSAENQMAQRLWQEYRGGGAAATTPEAATYGNVPQDASFAGAKLAAGGGTPYGMVPLSGTTAAPAPTRFTGGIEELKLRMGMEELGKKGLKEELERKNERERLDIAQGHLTLAAGREGRVSEAEAIRLENSAERLRLQQEAAAARAEANDRARSQKYVDDALKTWHASTDKYKGAQRDAAAYNKAIQASLDAVNKAVKFGDQYNYLDAISNIDSHFQAAQNQGLKVQMPKIASWEDLRAAQAKQEAVDAAARGDWNPLTDDAARAAALQKELEIMPGYREAPGRINPENYLAVPGMEEPVFPDLEQLRGQATTPAQGASAAAPPQATMSAAEYKAKTGEDVAPGTVKVDAKGRRLLITP